MTTDRLFTIQDIVWPLGYDHRLRIPLRITLNDCLHRARNLGMIERSADSMTATQWEQVATIEGVASRVLHDIHRATFLLEAQQESKKFSARFLRRFGWWLDTHGIWRNKGNGSTRFHPWPWVGAWPRWIGDAAWLVGSIAVVYLIAAGKLPWR